jgi:hypothetical protein
VPFCVGREFCAVADARLQFFRIARGTNTLGIEEDCAWGIPGTYTTTNFPCWEDGGNCQVKTEATYKAGPRPVAGDLARKMGRKAI